MTHTKGAVCSPTRTDKPCSPPGCAVQQRVQLYTFTHRLQDGVHVCTLYRVLYRVLYRIFCQGGKLGSPR